MGTNCSSINRHVLLPSPRLLLFLYINVIFFLPSAIPALSLHRLPASRFCLHSHDLIEPNWIENSSALLPIHQKLL